MNLAYKQLLKEVLKNKIFISLMFLLCLFTSFMYFFVHFSIDGNLSSLNKLSSLSSKELLYRNALLSNTTLASNILLGFIALTGFVFGMFFYGFFKKNSKVLGTLKTLGFKDQSLRLFFVKFCAMLTLLGGILGLSLSYFAADVLIRANSHSYELSVLTKALSFKSVLIGTLLPITVFCLITFLTYTLLKGQEISLLLSPTYHLTSNTVWLRVANGITQLVPTKDKFSIRLALRKPITLLLIFIAVTSFSIMFLLAYSLNLSSQTVYHSQTKGHYYLYDTHFLTSQLIDTLPSDTMPYISAQGALELGSGSLNQQVIGFEQNSEVFELIDSKGNTIPLPNESEIVISPALQDLYGLNVGDKIPLTIGERRATFTISHIAFNATFNSVYLSVSDLTQLLELSPHTYTGAWSMKNQFSVGTVITQAEKQETLERNFVSNRISALINQIMGCVIGCILLFLALLLNFQDSTRDILILHLLGYKIPTIRKMLIDLYKPIVWSFFIITLWPALVIVKTILRSLSLQIGDYIPFQTNIFVLIIIILLLNGLYLLVQLTFNLGVRGVIKKDSLYEYINNE